jgi:hypothetical protein
METLYVVQYNDCYGNGDKKLEVIVKTRKDFLDWLDKHNASRDAEPEGQEQFDLIPLQLYTSQIYHFDDWVNHMLSHSDYTESEIMEFELYYENLLHFDMNTSNFINFNQNK